MKKKRREGGTSFFCVQSHVAALTVWGRIQRSPRYVFRTPDETAWLQSKKRHSCLSTRKFAQGRNRCLLDHLFVNTQIHCESVCSWNLALSHFGVYYTGFSPARCLCSVRQWFHTMLTQLHYYLHGQQDKLLIRKSTSTTSVSNNLN